MILHSSLLKKRLWKLICTFRIDASVKPVNPDTGFSFASKLAGSRYESLISCRIEVHSFVLAFGFKFYSRYSLPLSSEVSENRVGVYFLVFTRKTGTSRSGSSQKTSGNSTLSASLSF
jgi:hypothetical protein